MKYFVPCFEKTADRHACAFLPHFSENFIPKYTPPTNNGSF